MASQSDFQEILPAFNQEPPSQMSPQQFQKKLYSFFEQKGLLSDLKSHLRVLMIRNLRETKLGRIEKNVTISLSKQAFNLIIAEHLLRESFYYTLSIFTTEVPGVAAQLPFSLFEAHCNRDTETRFDDESVLNLLELLGIPKGSPESLRISGLYFRNYSSLLACIITKKTHVLEINTENETQNLEQYLRNILKVTGIPNQSIERIIENVEKQQNFLHQKDLQALKTTLEERNKEIKHLHEIRKENKRLKHEVKEERIKISQLMKQEPVKLPCTLKHCDQNCSKELEKHRAEIERLRQKITSLVSELHKSQSKIEILNKLPFGSTKTIAVSCDSSDNSTEEILKKVRTKLADLERESDELDSKFRKLNLR